MYWYLQQQTDKLHYRDMVDYIIIFKFSGKKTNNNLLYLLLLLLLNNSYGKSKYPLKLDIFVGIIPLTMTA